MGTLTRLDQPSHHISINMKFSVVCAVIFMVYHCSGEEGGEGECADTWPDHCPSRVEKSPRDCYDDGIAKNCCKSCSAIKEEVKGCEYGDKASWCDSENSWDTDCSDQYVVDNCCKLCASSRK